MPEDKKKKKGDGNSLNLGYTPLNNDSPIDKTYVETPNVQSPDFNLEESVGNSSSDYDINKPSFNEYYATVPEGKNSTDAYDLEAAYDELPYEEMQSFATGESHLPDTYKKANHITFSNQSKYSNDETLGGVWSYDEETGQDVFTPSEYNLSQYSVDDYRQHFSKHNSNVRLNLPKELEDLELKDGYKNLSEQEQLEYVETQMNKSRAEENAANANLNNDNELGSGLDLSGVDKEYLPKLKPESPDKPLNEMDLLYNDLNDDEFYGKTGGSKSDYLLWKDGNYNGGAKGFAYFARKQRNKRRSALGVSHEDPNYNYYSTNIQADKTRVNTIDYAAKADFKTVDYYYSDENVSDSDFKEMFGVNKRSYNAWKRATDNGRDGESFNDFIETLNNQKRMQDHDRKPDHPWIPRTPGEQAAYEVEVRDLSFRASMKPNVFDDYINPAAWFGHLEKNMGESIKESEEQESIVPFLKNAASVVAEGALIGAAEIVLPAVARGGKQLVNEIAGKEVLKVGEKKAASVFEQNVANKTKNILEFNNTKNISTKSNEPIDPFKNSMFDLDMLTSPDDTRVVKFITKSGKEIEKTMNIRDAFDIAKIKNYTLLDAETNSNLYYRLVDEYNYPSLSPEGKAVNRYTLAYNEKVNHPKNIEKMKEIDRINGNNDRMRSLELFNKRIDENDIAKMRNNTKVVDEEHLKKIFPDFNADGYSGYTDQGKHKLIFSKHSDMSKAERELALNTKLGDRKIVVDKKKIDYNLISHENKHDITHGNALTGKDITDGKTKAFKTEDKLSSEIMDSNMSIDDANKTIENYKYYIENTEIDAYLGTNLKDELVDYGYIKHYTDDITPKLLKQIIKEGKTDLSRYKPYIKNYDELSKLINGLAYGTVIGTGLYTTKKK